MKKLILIDNETVCLLLEKKYKVKFKSSELAKLSSIENIFKVINKKANEKKKR